MINVTEARKGITIELDGQPYRVLDYQHQKIGRGSAQVRLKLRDLRGGHIVEDRRPRAFSVDVERISYAGAAFVISLVVRINPPVIFVVFKLVGQAGALNTVPVAFGIRHTRCLV